jgi:aspartyl-tRNA(Asn)/glutamyl-tRNA(Gln) amidotransferase subunit C
MGITKKTVEQTAHLARIELEPKELEKLSAQLEKILDFIDQLEKAQIKDIDPTSHILSLRNVLRPDETRDSLAGLEALKNAPQQKGNFFLVPKIIE